MIFTFRAYHRFDKKNLKLPYSLHVSVRIMYICTYVLIFLCTTYMVAQHVNENNV